MKKLMILAAVAAVGLAANASSFAWTITPQTAKEVKASNLADFIGATAYVVLSGYQSATYANIDAIVAASTMNGTEGVTGNSATIVQAPNLRSTSTQEQTFYAPSGVASGSQDFYFVIVKADGTEYWQSGTYTADTWNPDAEPAEQGKPGYTLDNFTTLEGATWTKFAGGDVPEPTSAMLLLLGVAGLALKRKQA